MTESCLTTGRERDVFKDLVKEWLKTELRNAPREQLHAIEAVMYRYRPLPRFTADDRPIYGANGSRHLYGDGRT